MSTIITDPKLVAFLKRLDAVAATLRPKYPHLYQAPPPPAAPAVRRYAEQVAVGIPPSAWGPQGEEAE